MLCALDSDLFRVNSAVFAGGTRISMALSEYRVSRDVDFLVSDTRGYAELRAAARGAQGVHGLFKKTIEILGDARVDQYGIRFPVRVDEEILKVEIVAEGRVQLEPGVPRGTTGIPWATDHDCYLEKLLANSDRGRDSSTLFRDLIDLAALRAQCGPVPQAVLTEAERVYGPSVMRDLVDCIEAFRTNAEFRRKALSRLRVSPAEMVEHGVDLLANDFI